MNRLSKVANSSADRDGSWLEDAVPLNLDG